MKNEIINIRVTKEDKETLIRLAKKEKKTVSGYLIQKGLSEKRGSEGIPLLEKMEIIDILNEIWHRVQKCKDQELKADIETFYGEKFSGLREGKK